MGETQVTNPTADTAPTSDPTPTSSSATKKSKSKSKSAIKASSSSQKKTFKGETSDMNSHVFQTIDESKDATQYIKTLEALERYANKTYDVDMSSIFARPKGVLPSIPLPKTPDASAAQVYKDLYSHEIKQFGIKKDKLTLSLKALWSVIWGQCSPNMITKLEEEERIESLKTNGDVVQLLELIHQICMKFTSKTNPILTLVKHLGFVFSYRQREKDDVHKYLELFKLMIDSISRVGGSFGNHFLVTKTVMIDEKHVKATVSDADAKIVFDKLDKDVQQDVKHKAENRVLAMMFLLGGRPDKYQNLLVDLQNQFIRGNDQFPKTLTDSYNLMSNYTPSLTTSALDPQQQKIDQQSVYDLGMHFFQKVEPVEKQPVFEVDNDILNFFDVVSEQDDDDSSVSTTSVGVYNFSFLQRAVKLSFNQIVTTSPEDRYADIEPTWILLDTQSNCDIFNNKRMLSSIYSVEGPGMLLQSNGGFIKTHKMGELEGYGSVWYNKQSLANILSLANVRKKFRVTLETGPSDPCPCIYVHCNKGKILKFKEHSMGLYVYDLNESIKLN